MKSEVPCFDSVCEQVLCIATNPPVLRAKEKGQVKQTTHTPFRHISTRPVFTGRDLSDCTAVEHVGSVIGLGEGKEPEPAHTACTVLVGGHRNHTVLEEPYTGQAGQAW